MVFNEIYFYEPGKCGINFDKILRPEFFAHGEFPINGESGEVLLCEVNPDMLSIRVEREKSFLLQAHAKGGIMSFNLRTRVNRFIGSPKTYKDLRAARFMRVAYSFFVSQGNNIAVCEGKWHKGYVNREEFDDNLAEGMSQSQAAIHTWSGQQFVNLGFPLVLDELIRSKINTMGHEYISAPFFLDSDVVRWYRDSF